MIALAFGIIGCLVFGAGLAFMTHIIGSSVVPGIPMMIVGAAVIVAAYPVFKSVRNKKTAELAPRILALTDELMKK